MNMNPTFTRLSPSEQALALQRRRRSMQEFSARQQAHHDLNPGQPQPNSEPQPQQETPAAPARPRMSQEAAFETYALSGLAGTIVRTLAPHTEAQPAAILLQLLVAFGNVIGAGPHCMVGATRHGLNLFAILVGESSKARKGTSWSQIAHLFAEVDRPWIDTRVNSARLTANGLISALRDQDHATDRRLLVLSEEFASVLHTMARTRTQVSPLLRSAWDTGTLRALHHDKTLQATGTHISLIGHITQRELMHYLDRTETHNGFANRCLWLCVERAGCVPDGGNLGVEELSATARELRSVIDWAHGKAEILFQRDQAATELWNDFYPTLSQANPGIYSAADGRAEAQVLRLSAIYAALDCSETIRLPHLYAALAVWDRCMLNAGALFGICTGDTTADRIHEALQASPQGLSKSQISMLFHGRVNIDAINQSLEHLQSLGMIYARVAFGRGRAATIWCLSESREAVPVEEQETVDLEESVSDGAME